MASMHRPWLTRRSAGLAFRFVGACLAVCGDSSAQDAAGAEAAPCASSAYGDAWGRSSRSGDLTLCRVPATSAGTQSRDYELREGGALLWALRLPHVLEDAIVSDAGVVDGYVPLEGPRGLGTPVHLVTISVAGVVEREWTLRIGPDAFLCADAPPVAGFARVDESRIAVLTRNEELFVLDADGPTDVHAIELGRVYGKPGESSWIAEWDVVPDAELVVLRVGYSLRYPGEHAPGPGSSTWGGYEDLGMRLLVVGWRSELLWTGGEPCTRRTPDARRPDAVGDAFRLEREERVVVSEGLVTASLCAGRPPVRLTCSKDASGAWQVRAPDFSRPPSAPKR